MVWAGTVCMNGCHGKLSVGQSSGFVEHNGSHLGQSIHIVAALDENTVPGCSADAAKEGEGHADDQGAWAGNHQKYQARLSHNGKFSPKVPSPTIPVAARNGGITARAMAAKTTIGV